jgi:hypothetical protein
MKAPFFILMASWQWQNELQVLWMYSAASRPVPFYGNGLTDIGWPDWREASPWTFPCRTLQIEKLMSLPNYLLSDAASVAVSDLCGKNGLVQGALDLRLTLSISLSSRVKHTVVIPGPTKLLTGVGPMTVEAESRFISTMIKT